MKIRTTLPDIDDENFMEEMIAYDNYVNIKLTVIFLLIFGIWLVAIYRLLKI